MAPHNADPCPHNQRYHATAHYSEPVRVAESIATSVTVTGTTLSANLFGGEGCSSTVPLCSGGYILLQQYSVQYSGGGWEGVGTRLRRARHADGATSIHFA